MSGAVAGIVSLTAWAGLAVQFAATLAVEQSVPATLWILVHFFTIVTNLLLAILFGALALGRRDIATPGRLGGITLAILLVGIVYALLLTGLHPLRGGALIADGLLHKATPVLAPLGWLVAAPKGGLTRRDPWLWTLYPLAYFAYALVRGAVEGRFAYPFLDFPAHGWTHVAVHAVVMAAGFVSAGHLLLWLDQRLSRIR
ncbi:Pr6Pr family membrane protein [Sphingobium sufflavum]|uniref:Pr6Pr family membrane protein n=1 Tax=Sphingobium sufflavum TaxID=1129547 RepID=UPI001F46545A|nr:Pr6Pr family membrane protein [Sphingobium sufflavum]MCE7797706.1 Pr6Pr family membrane protein [Sphingobium sufflavum]